MKVSRFYSCYQQAQKLIFVWSMNYSILYENTKGFDVLYQLCNVMGIWEWLQESVAKNREAFFIGCIVIVTEL